ncbi:hypothetical protein HED60_15990 [Planctomycetales bacterium ZRK34]|nr:hypothetical protein HED60_15990 [Planctomycetales bacterium ZRK34]
MSQFNAPAYDIERPTGQCAFTGRTLEPDEQYIAALVEDGDNLKRLDICQQAWDEGKRPDDLFSYWKATVPQPQEKKKLFVDDAVLMNLLERLADADQPQRIAFRFVLTLIMMRKKLLRYDKTDKRTIDAPEGQQIEEEWWVLTPKLDLSKGPLGKWDDSRKLEVLDPHLDEEGTRAVTDQLSQILQAEL